MDENIHHNVTPLTVLHRSTSDHGEDVAQQCSLAKQSCILLVIRGSRLAEPVMDYAVNVADRMGCKILATYINTLPLFGNGDVHHKQFASAIEPNVAEFKEKAVVRGVDFEYVQESGKISKIIGRLCRIIKRIEFVLIDQGIKIEEAAFGSPVPVFNIVCTDPRTGKMVGNRRAKRKLPEERFTPSFNRKNFWIKTLVSGSMLGGLYAAILTNLELIVQYFTTGGLYALMPAAMAVAALYVHVSFFRNLMCAFGVVGPKAAVAKKAEESQALDKRPYTKPRMQRDA